MTTWLKKVKPLGIGFTTAIFIQLQFLLFGITSLASLIVSFNIGILFFVLALITQKLLQSQQRLTNKLLRFQKDSQNQSDKRVMNQLSELKKNLQKSMKLELGYHFHQIEATIQLESLYGYKAQLPASRGWAASPDLILEILNLIDEKKPSVVVELGSGLSTIWIARALEMIGSGNLISIDHNRGFADMTLDNLRKHSLNSFAELRIGELEFQVWRDGAENWYPKSIFDGINQIDLLIVDGPPKSPSDTYRWPAMWVLESRMNSSATIILDDAVREPEMELAMAWSRLGNYTLQVKSFEKKAAVLSR